MYDDYDGIVKIKTGLDLDTLEKDAGELEKTLDQSTGRLRNLGEVIKTYTQNFGAALRATNDSLATQLGLVTRLKETFDQMPYLKAQAAQAGAGGGTRRVQSSEYSALQKEAERVGARLDEQAEKLRKMVETTEGGYNAVSGKRSYVSLQYDIELLRTRWEELLEKMREIEDAGKRFVDVPAQTKERADSVTKLAAEYMKLAQNAQKAAEAESANANELNQKYADIVNQLPEQFRAIMEEVTASLSEGITGSDDSVTEEVEQVEEKVVEAHTKVRDESNKTAKTVQKNSGTSFANVLKYAVGLRGAYVVWSKMRAAAKESLGVMAQYDPQLNATISRTLTAMKQLKADVGTIIQPIVSTLSPVLTVILNKVHSIAHGVAQFVAALVGQDYIEVATVQAYDYAKALDTAAESAKALGAYDKLNIINKNDTANTLALTKDTVKYTKEALDNNSWTVKLGKRLHEIWQDAKAVFDDIYDRLSQAKWFQDLKEKLKKILNDPDELLKYIGIVGLGIALGKMLLGGVAASGFGAGIMGLIPKVAVVALTAVVGYKIGEKIFESLPDGLKDELGKQVYDILLEFGIIDENGDPVDPEELGDNLKEKAEEAFDNSVFGKSYAAGKWLREKIIQANNWLNKNKGWLVKDGGGIQERGKKSTVHTSDGGHTHSGGGGHWGVEVEPEYTVKEPTEEDKRKIALQTQLYYTQLHAENQLRLKRFINEVKPIIAEFNVNFKEKFGRTPQEAFAAIRDALTGAWNSPNNVIKTGLSSISSSFKTLWESAWETPQEKARKKLVEGLRAAGDNLKSLWDDPNNNVKSTISSIGSAFKSLFAGAFNAGTEQGDTEWVGKRFKNIGDRFQSNWDAKDNPIKTTLEKIKSGFKSIWNALFNADSNELPKFTVSNDQKTNAEKQGKTLGEKVRDGFKSVFAGDQDMSKTVVEKVSGALVSGYNLATQALAIMEKNMASLNAAKNAAVSTTKQGDIVLTLDGKVVAKSVWDNTSKVYKQTGVSML